MGVKILIAIPTNANIQPETFKAVYDLEIPEGHKADFQFFHGYRIDQIRNLILDYANRGDYDFIFFVDSDVTFPKNTLALLLQEMKVPNTAIAAGVYAQRTENPIVEVMNFEGKHYEFIDVTADPNVGGVGFGCALCSVEVAASIPYPQFEYHIALDHADTVSEDWIFCEKVRQKGLNIRVKWDLICPHKGVMWHMPERIAVTPMTPEVETKFLPPQQPDDDQRFLNELSARKDLLPESHVEVMKNLRDRHGFEPKVIYDIGACVLHWRNNIKPVWPEAHFVNIDAIEEVAPILEQAGRSNGDGWCIAVLGEEDNKPVTFWKNIRNAGGCSVFRETTGEFTEQHAQQRLTARLDALRDYFNWPLPDLVKIDVQGSELAVLRGGWETIKHARYIVIETQHTDYNEGAPKHNEVNDFLLEHRFVRQRRIHATNVDADYLYQRID